MHSAGNTEAFSSCPLITSSCSKTPGARSASKSVAGSGLCLWALLTAPAILPCLHPTGIRGSWTFQPEWEWSFPPAGNNERGQTVTVILFGVNKVFDWLEKRTGILIRVFKHARGYYEEGSRQLLSIATKGRTKKEWAELLATELHGRHLGEKHIPSNCKGNYTLGQVIHGGLGVSEF